MTHEEGSPPGAGIDAYRAGYEEEHVLRGFRSACGFVGATWGLRCPRCGDRWVETPLSPKGTVVAFSVQTVPSDEFLNDAPYAYVLVELEGGGRISGLMAEVRSESDLEIGAPVEFVPSYRPGVHFQRRPALSGTPGPG